MQLHAERSLKVFLSHASQDLLIVRLLYEALKADGVAAWLAEEDLNPGSKWQIAIPEEVRNSDVVIVCLSEGSVSKEGYFQKEIALALDVASEKPEGTIFLIPVRLDKCDIPDRLKIYQWVDLFDRTSIDKHHYLRLMRSLKKRADEVGADLFLHEKQFTQNAASQITIKEFTFNPVTLDFLRLRQEQRTAMEVSALVRFLDKSILQHILLSYDDIYKEWSGNDFSQLIRDWELRGFLKWDWSAPIICTRDYVSPASTRGGSNQAWGAGGRYPSEL